MPRKKDITQENLPDLIKVAKISKVDQLQFTEFKKLADEWADKAKKIVVKTVADTEAMDQAKDGYDFLNNKYKELDNLRKDLGEESLRKTQAINDVGNYFKGLIEPILEDLKKKRDFKKEATKKSLDAIADKRLAELSTYGSTLARDVAASMTEDVYQNYLIMAQKTHNELFKEPVSEAVVEGKPVPTMMVGSVLGTKDSPAIIKPKSDKEKLQTFIAQLNLLQYPDVDNETVLLAFQNLDEAVQTVILIINKL